MFLNISVKKVALIFHFCYLWTQFFCHMFEQPKSIIYTFKMSVSKEWQFSIPVADDKNVSTVSWIHDGYNAHECIFIDIYYRCSLFILNKCHDAVNPRLKYQIITINHCHSDNLFQSGVISVIRLVMWLTSHNIPRFIQIV